MKIAVLDDGIYTASSISLRKLSFDLEYRGGTIQEREAPLHPASHGTIVADIIQTYAPNAQIGSIKILEEGCKGSAQALAAGIRWCASHSVDIIHMSVGTSVWQDFFVIEEAVQSVSKDKVLLAASDNLGRTAVPASLPYVWSVTFQRDQRFTKIVKKANNAWDIYSSLQIPYQIQMHYSLQNGFSNSFQAAAVSGCLAKENLFFEVLDKKKLLTVFKKYSGFSEILSKDENKLQIERNEAKSFFLPLPENIPVVWIQLHSKKPSYDIVKEELSKLLCTFYKHGYYAVSLDDCSGRNWKESTFFQRCSSKINSSVIVNCLNKCRCDILFVLSESSALKDADTLLIITEKNYFLYDNDKGILIYEKDRKVDSPWGRKTAKIVLHKLTNTKI